MKTKIILSVALFAASFILEGVATRIMPFGEIGKIVLDSVRKC